MPRTGRRTVSPVRQRLQQLRGLKIEYVSSPEFARPELRREILRPWDGPAAGQPVAPPPETPPYLAALYEIPLLTPEQEFHLFRQMNYHKYLAAQLQQRLRRRASRPVAESLERHLAEAAALRNAIVQANLRLVVAIAKTLVDPANSLDDLMSEGNLPLMRAAEIFDFTRGLRFSTYATWAIRNGLLRVVKRNRRRRQRAVTGVDELLSQHRETRTSALGGERHWEQLQASAARLLEQLTPRERLIVAARFGLDGESRAAPFREIAVRLDLSTERVRQLLTKALHRLRTLSEPALANAG
jgi:RNA polymerase primary sigma factor